jgi:hypothetical protein
MKGNVDFRETVNRRLRLVRIQAKKIGAGNAQHGVHKISILGRFYSELSDWSARKLVMYVLKPAMTPSAPLTSQSAKRATPPTRLSFCVTTRTGGSVSALLASAVVEAGRPI